MSDEVKYPETIFFFGAGASKKANIPDTYEFVDEFVNYIINKGNRKEINCLNEIILILKERKGKESRIDIEELLASLEKISHKNEDLLSAFYKSNAFALTDGSQVVSLEKELKNFIRTRVIAKSDDVEYLSDLFRFNFPLAVFSVNYDTCIEQLCYNHRIRYSDGFALFWQGDDEFLRLENQVRLYKIHGSAIWYESDTKEYLKIPLSFKSEKLGEPTEFKLIFGEATEPLITYPIQKWEYVEPLTELQLKFKEQLVNLKTKCLVIVGYSFRDEYILRMLFDAKKKNDELIVILIDLNALRLYQEKLEYYDVDKQIPSSLKGSVLLLPYPFENALPKLYEVIELLTAAQVNERQSRDQERRTGRPNYSECLEQYINAGFSYRYNAILERVDWDKIRFDYMISPKKVVLAFKALLDSLSLGDGNEKIWIQRFNESFSFLSAVDLDANVSTAGFSLMFKTKYQGGQVVRLYDLESHIFKPLLTSFDEKENVLGLSLAFKLQGLNDTIERLKGFREFVNKYSRNVSWEQTRLKDEIKGKMGPEMKDIFSNHLLPIYKNELIQLFTDISFKCILETETI